MSARPDSLWPRTPLRIFTSLIFCSLFLFGGRAWARQRKHFELPLLPRPRPPSSFPARFHRFSLIFILKVRVHRARPLPICWRSPAVGIEADPAFNRPEKRNCRKRVVRWNSDQSRCGPFSTWCDSVPPGIFLFLLILSPISSSYYYCVIPEWELFFDAHCIACLRPYGSRPYITSTSQV